MLKSISLYAVIAGAVVLVIGRLLSSNQPPKSFEGDTVSDSWLKEHSYFTGQRGYEL